LRVLWSYRYSSASRADLVSERVGGMIPIVVLAVAGLVYIFWEYKR
jgi:hypothetical protein